MKDIYSFNKFSIEEVEAALTESVLKGGEPELILYMYHKKYMIIAYKNKFTFQRCATKKYNYQDGSGEIEYATFNDLINSKTVDNIVLKRAWKDIESFDWF